MSFFLTLLTVAVPFKLRNSTKIPYGWVKFVPSLNTIRIKTVRVSVCICSFFSKNVWRPQVIWILFERGKMSSDIFGVYFMIL